MPRGGARQKLKDEDHYLAAQLLAEGYSPSAIAERLFETAYKSLPRAEKSRMIGRVRKLLRRAAVLRMLRVVPPLKHELRRALEACADFEGIRFYVVSDTAHGRRASDPVYRAAARLIEKRVDRIIRLKLAAAAGTAGTARVVIANAGGPALSRAVEHLANSARPLHQAQVDLQCVSLNASRSHKEYHLSANFIAVRMAAIYGGSHFASLPPQSKEYDKLIAGIDLLICGAGARGAFLDRWIEGSSSKTRSAALGPSVGDICFIPVDQDGREVRLKDRIRQRIDHELRPQPGYAALRRLGRDGKVIAVFAYPDEVPEGVDRATLERDKAIAAIAILNGRLATACVLGISFATTILNVLQAAKSQK